MELDQLEENPTPGGCVGRSYTLFSNDDSSASQRSDWTGPGYRQNIRFSTHCTRVRSL